MRLTEHAIMRFSERTGVDILKSKEELEKRLDSLKTDGIKPVDAVTAKQSGFHVKSRKRHRNDKFYMWIEPTISDIMCAVIRDDVVITVMVRDSHGFKNPHKLPKRRLKTIK